MSIPCSIARALAVLVLFLIAGCAGLSARDVGDAGSSEDGKARGFRFYQQAPFLFIRSDGKGGLQSDIQWLPDTRRVISARPYAWLAKNETTLEFADGTLSKASTTLDETAVPTATLSALAKVMTAAAMNAVPEIAEGRIPTPYLFRILTDENGVHLLGGPAQDATGTHEVEIRVTMPAPGATP
jgi:hypothetical protein